MAAETWSQLPDDTPNTGKKVHARSLLVGVDTVLNQNFELTDSTNNLYARVLATLPAATDAGLVVRLVGSYAEDTPAADGDPGVAMLGVRQDLETAKPTSDAGDYATLTLDSMGRLRVINRDSANLTELFSQFFTRFDLFMELIRSKM